MKIKNSQKYPHAGHRQRLRTRFLQSGLDGFLYYKIVGGAYRTMIERLQSNNNPNFFLLDYDLQNFEVRNFLVIPKHFFLKLLGNENRLHAVSSVANCGH